MRMLLWTISTPGADHAEATACVRATNDLVRPLSHTSCPVAATQMPLESESALRCIAETIFERITFSEAAAFTTMSLWTQETPLVSLTARNAELFWNCKSTEPVNVTIPLRTVALTPGGTVLLLSQNPFDRERNVLIGSSVAVDRQDNDVVDHGVDALHPACRLHGCEAVRHV